MIRKVLTLLAASAFALFTMGQEGCDTSTTSDEPDKQSKATPTARAEPDTGRMSQGEWETARDAVNDINGEMRDYTDTVGGRCATILSAGEASEGLKCLDDAFEGVEGSAGLTTEKLRGLIDDTARTCRKRVRRAANRLNRPLFQALGVSRKAFDTGDAEVVALALEELLKQRRLWGDASGDMLQACAPE